MADIAARVEGKSSLGRLGLLVHATAGYVDPGWDTFWGLGFAIQRADGRTFVGHGGSCPGYRSQLLLDMDDEIATVFMANASGVDTGKFVRGMYDLLAPALRAAAGREDEGDERVAEDGAPSSPRATNAAAVSSPAAASPAASPPLSDYVGTYSVQPWGGETAVVLWKGGLALLPLPSKWAIEYGEPIDTTAYGPEAADDPLLGEVPVLLLSAWARDVDVWSGWMAGADAYVTKPMDVDDLLTQITRLTVAGPGRLVS